MYLHLAGVSVCLHQTLVTEDPSWHLCDSPTSVCSAHVNVSGCCGYYTGNVNWPPEGSVMVWASDSHKCPIIFINPPDTQKYRFHGSLCCLLILHQGADSQKCSSAERCCLIEKSLHMHYFLTLLGDKVATPGLVIIDVSVRMCKTYFCVWIVCQREMGFCTSIENDPLEFACSV